MKSDYSRDIFKQLEETMKRLDKMESTLENTKIKHKIEIGHLNDKIASLEKENAALKIENTRLKDDNERLRRIINNDSTNSSLPPSSDEKPVKAANEFNHRNSNSSAVQKRLCKLLVTAGRLRVVCTIFSMGWTPQMNKVSSQPVYLWTLCFFWHFMNVNDTTGTIFRSLRQCIQFQFSN